MKRKSRIQPTTSKRFRPAFRDASDNSIFALPLLHVPYNTASAHSSPPGTPSPPGSPVRTSSLARREFDGRATPFQDTDAWPEQTEAEMRDELQSTPYIDRGLAVAAAGLGSAATAVAYTGDDLEYETAEDYVGEAPYETGGVFAMLADGLESAATAVAYTGDDLEYETAEDYVGEAPHETQGVFALAADVGSEVKTVAENAYAYLASIGSWFSGMD